MNLSSFLLGIVGPLALRVLTALGISTLTFTGVTAGLQSVIDLVTQNYGGIAGATLSLAGIAGVPQALGIICGAMTARVGLWVAVSATRFVVSGSS